VILRRRNADLAREYRVAGEAAAAVAEVKPEAAADRQAAAFFDIDNTVMRGASMFHIARGLARRQLFRAGEVADFAWKQTKFVLSGSENLDDMREATEAALQFVKGRRVKDVLAFGEEIFEERMMQKLWPGTLAMAQEHLDQGQRVWLVSATPVELASIIADRLGLTGALGTVAEIIDGVYTGRLVGLPLHGPAKAEAVSALAAREELDLSRCSAYSDSSNDIPLLSIVGFPCAVNPDRRLGEHARTHGWQVRDYRRRTRVRNIRRPLMLGAANRLALGSGFTGSRGNESDPHESIAGEATDRHTHDD
jgi:HAD superfamily hydrolase (TIGR01490 family)